MKRHNTYVEKTVSMWEETRIAFSPASDSYLGMILTTMWLISEYTSDFPLKRPPTSRFTPDLDSKKSTFTSTSKWAVSLTFSTSASTYCKKIKKTFKIHKLRNKNGNKDKHNNLKGVEKSIRRNRMGTKLSQSRDVFHSLNLGETPFASLFSG